MLIFLILPEILKGLIAFFMASVSVATSLVDERVTIN
jgi:hypothetical protein